MCSGKGGGWKCSGREQLKVGGVEVMNVKVGRKFREKVPRESCREKVSRDSFKKGSEWAGA